MAKKNELVNYIEEKMKQSKNPFLKNLIYQMIEKVEKGLCTKKQLIWMLYDILPDTSFTELCSLVQ